MTTNERTRRTKRCSDPSQAIAKQLYGTASKCGAPDCYEPFFKLDGGQRTLNSRIAHMRASSPNGPRADPYMTCEEVNHFDNLIVLCLFHATHIDDHEDEYPIEMLEEWKRQQLADGETLNTPAVLTEEELLAAVSAVSASQASTDVLIELARAVRSLRSTAERSRTGPAQVCQHRRAQIAQLNSGLRPWNSETGELLDLELPHVEEEGYRRQIIESLDRTAAEIRPVADRVREAAAGAAVTLDGSSSAMEWLERSVTAVVEQATRWPADLDADPAVALNAALTELDLVVVAFQTLAAGESIDVPEPPQPEPPAPPTPIEQIIETYAPLVEAAGPHLRVDHLPYDPELHQALLACAEYLAGLPGSMELMKTGTTLLQNAGATAAVCRNANDDDLLAVVESAAALLPECAAAEHLKSLRLLADKAERPDRVEAVDAAIGRTGLAVLESVGTTEFWERNAWHAPMALALAAHGAGEEKIEDRLRAAFDREDLTIPVLVALAPTVDQLDSRNHTYVQTRRSYSEHNRLPSWIPTDELVEVVRRRWPDLPELRNGVSDHIEDDLERLAAEFVAIYSPRESTD